MTIGMIFTPGKKHLYIQSSRSLSVLLKTTNHEDCNLAGILVSRRSIITYVVFQISMLRRYLYGFPVK
jgi:hypothetical protein